MDHQSIGEVLATLRDEFPDITISKIRFLESQGLIDPERTPSGYRKFRPADVARLRWILHQQKDNFLPLKVIKERLDLAGPDELPADGAPPDADAATTPQTSAADPADGVNDDPADEGATAAPSKAKPKPKRARARQSATPKTGAATSAAAHPRRAETEEAATLSWESPTLPLDDGDADSLDPAATGVSFTRRELAAATGLSDGQIDEAEQYGLIAPAAGSGTKVVYDESALVVGKLLLEFAGHGIGPRHLRMYRAFADREAGLFDQVIAPRLRRRNPDARSQAREDLVDLARLGRALRLAFLRDATAGMLRD